MGKMFFKSKEENNLVIPPEFDGFQKKEVTIPPIRIGLDQIDFTWNYRDGKMYFLLLWNHPIFPVAFEVPFDGLFYVRQFAEQAQKAVTHLEQRENTSA